MEDVSRRWWIRHLRVLTRERDRQTDVTTACLVHQTLALGEYLTAWQEMRRNGASMQDAAAELLKMATSPDLTAKRPLSPGHSQSPSEPHQNE